MAALTEQQQAFAEFLAAGDNQADAYRKAYPASANWTNNALYVNASKLAKHKGVLAAVKELRAPAVAAAELTIESHLAELARLREFALRTNQPGAAVTAEMARGKVAGFYIERRENGNAGEFAALDAMRKQDAIEAINAEIERRARLAVGANDVTDVEAKDETD